MENTKKQNSNVSSKTRTLVSSALFAALVCVTTAYFLHIPVGNGGYVHVGDTFIYLATIFGYISCCSRLRQLHQSLGTPVHFGYRGYEADELSGKAS